MGTGVAVGSGVGVGLAVGSALGMALGVAVAVGVLLASATWDGFGLCPGLASVFATRATRIAEVPTTPTIPTLAFRLNAVAPPSSCVASVRQDWVSNPDCGLAEDTGGSSRGRKTRSWRSIDERDRLTT